MKQWLNLSALAVAGCIDFMMLTADENPDGSTSLSEFVTMKIIGILLLAAIVIVAKRLDSKGLLPYISEEED